LLLICALENKVGDYTFESVSAKYSGEGNTDRSPMEAFRHGTVGRSVRGFARARVALLITR
jgi:hypothetical protein